MAWRWVLRSAQSGVATGVCGVNVGASAPVGVLDGSATGVFAGSVLTGAVAGKGRGTATTQLINSMHSTQMAIAVLFIVSSIMRGNYTREAGGSKERVGVGKGAARCT
jgi:hypothetical protein